MLQKYHLKKKDRKANNLYIEDWFRGFRFKGDFLLFSVPREYRGLLAFPLHTHDHLSVCMCVSSLLHHSSPDCPQHLTNDTYLQLALMDWEE